MNLTKLLEYLAYIAYISNHYSDEDFPVLAQTLVYFNHIEKPLMLRYIDRLCPNCKTLLIRKTHNAKFEQK